MDHLDKITAKEVTGFMDHWKKHPLSIPILIIVLNLSFFLILIQGTLDEKKIELAYIFCGASVLIFIIIVIVLVWRKFVFYNATELIILEIDRYIRAIQETLADIEIGTGAAFDDLQAPPIGNEVISNVRRFEILHALLKNIGFEPAVNDATIKALTKYYYRNAQYDKALMWLDKGKSKVDSDFNFIRGLVLWKKGAFKASRESFAKSEHPRANYYKFVTFTSTFDCNLTKTNLMEYIQEVTNDKSPLHLDMYAQINLGVAYQNIALHFPQPGVSVDIVYLQKALLVVEDIIKIHNHSFGYFNAACIISVLGAYNADLDNARKYDEATYVKLSINHLEQALSQNPKLLDRAINDNDFVWLKNKAEKEYHRLIGQTYYKKTLKTH